GETLRWSAQSPFVGAVAGYMVEKVGASGQVLGSYDVGLATTWTADVNDTDQTVVYRVRATATNGQTSISNTVLLVRVVSLFIPNGFSPNNDQINDVFELKGQFIEKGAVTIFDRWGNVLYHTNDWQKGWDGKDAKGQNVAGGFYAYRVVYTDGKKNDYTKTGTVYLVR
ncbi:MAG: gliding motility-associated C-terminal domain-containing protein, partial [Runella slithyformis]